MGCSSSLPQRGAPSSLGDDAKSEAIEAPVAESFSFRANVFGVAAELLTEGDTHDQGRWAAILQLSTTLNLLVTESGRTEIELCEKAVAARKTGDGKWEKEIAAAEAKCEGLRARLGEVK